jgi:hypothetical protein
MQCQQFCNLMGTAVVELLESPPDSAVIDSAMAFEQAAVGGFLG